MAMAEFAMVEELALLIKDNLISKHLVLSTEEALVDCLQNDPSSDRVLELQPMGPYHRLLLHRLADIYGFVHESVGEGDDRHLVLGRCPESAIPSILVSDIVYQYDDQSSTSLDHILKRDEAPALRSKQTLGPSKPFEEREAAYLAARERIFSLHVDEEKDVTVPKSRRVPLVAQRMISHALGQKICTRPSSQQLSLPKHEEATPSNDSKEDMKQLVSVSRTTDDENVQLVSDSFLHGRKVNNEIGCKSYSNTDIPCADTKVQNRISSNASSNGCLVPTGVNNRMAGCQNLKKEQMGAAKRMFAHALGLPSPKGNHTLLSKPSKGKNIVIREK